MDKLFVAEQVKAARKALRLTQKELAAALGCSALDVSRWERGVRPPDYSLIYRQVRKSG